MESDKKSFLYRVVMTCVASIMLSNCASKTPKEQNYYVLSQSSSSQSISVSGTPRASISRVNLPEYLNQQYIVRQQSDDVITVLTFELWAEKLSRSIPAILAAELAAEVGRPIETHPLPPGIHIDTTIEINIRQLIASDKQLILKADYRIVNPPRLQTFPFQVTLPLSNATTTTLVNGYNIALAKLAIDIANHLK